MAVIVEEEAEEENEEGRGGDGRGAGTFLGWEENSSSPGVMLGSP